MDNLVIGNTSQLSHYFPDSYNKISSRNINFDEICEKKYERVYLLFAEQRTFINEGEDFFTKVNFDYTVSVINKLKDISNHIIIYSTSELWNNVDGCVSLERPFDYNYSPYISSKEKLCNFIKQNKELYRNVIIIYPFNFNSVFRKNGFLFGKIFDSIINNKKISIGDINFKRDLIHPKKIVELSITANSDLIIGSGQLINVQKFVEDIFTHLDKDIVDFIEYDKKNNILLKRTEYFSCEKFSDYDELINLTIKDIHDYKLS